MSPFDSAANESPLEANHGHWYPPTMPINWMRIILWAAGGAVIGLGGHYFFGRFQGYDDAIMLALGFGFIEWQRQRYAAEAKRDA